MGARGDLRHHAAEAGVLVGLRAHDIGQDFAAAVALALDHGGRGLVAGGLDPQYQHRLVVSQCVPLRYLLKGVLLLRYHCAVIKCNRPAAAKLPFAEFWTDGRSRHPPAARRRDHRRRFARAGFCRPSAAPMLRFEPFGFRDDEDVAYGAVIVTSVNALRAHRIRNLRAAVCSKLPLFAVGEQTGRRRARGRLCRCDRGRGRRRRLARSRGREREGEEAEEGAAAALSRRRGTGARSCRRTRPQGF